MIQAMHNFMKLKYFAKDEKNPYLNIFTCTGHYMSIKRYVYSIYEKITYFYYRLLMCTKY